MYQITLQGTDVSLIGLPMYSGVYGDLGNFSCKIKNSAKNKILLKHRIEIVIKRSNKIVFTGLLTGIAYGAATIDLSGWEIAAKLGERKFYKNQGQTDQKRLQYDNTAANSIINDMLIVAQAAPDLGFTLGVCPATTISLIFEIGSCLQLVVAVADRLGVEWEITADKVINIATSIGGVKGEIPLRLRNKKFEDSFNLVNEWFGYGARDGISQITGSDSDSDSIDEYGNIEDHFVDPTIDDDTVLGAKATLLVAETKDPIVRLPASIKVMDWLTNNLKAGDIITVTRKRTEISGNYKIKSWKYLRGKYQVELGNRLEDPDDILAHSKSLLDIRAVYTPGSTNFLVFDFNDSLDAAKDLDKDIFIPTKTKSVIRVMVNFDMKNYRAYATASGAGSAHTHTVNIGAGGAHTHSVTGTTSDNDGTTGGSHNHPVFNWDSNTPGGYAKRKFWGYGASIYVDLYTYNQNQIVTLTGNQHAHIHNHDVSGQTASSSNHTHAGEATESESAHTHGLSYGIYEEALAAPSVDLWIDGTDRTGALGGPWNSKVSELDISAFITTTGAHEVTFKANKRMRLDGSIIPEVFISSN